MIHCQLNGIDGTLYGLNSEQGEATTLILEG